MKNSSKKQTTGPFFRRHKVLSVVGIIVLVILVCIVAWQISVKIQVEQYQARLQPFYTPPSPLPPGNPGDIIRQEPLNVSVPNGTGYRVLYRTQQPDGSAAVSSGMIFIPNSAAPSGGRKVVAWAHGTVGLGDSCAPSRNQNPIYQITTWIGDALANGWVVTATDYTGLGTPGIPYYLIGKSEANDVLNSVRVARNFAGAQASNQFAVFGHSQGGHAALSVTAQAAAYAPELQLVATTAAAPAVELQPLINEQYQHGVSWAIGPLVALSWPNVYQNLPLSGVLSDAGMRNYKRLANGCVLNEATGIELRSLFHQQFFQTNPINNPTWDTALSQQTPPPSNTNVPILVVQGLNDNVVLPNTTALLVQNMCSAGDNVTTSWLGDTGHLQLALISGPSVVEWIDSRFAGQPTSPTCAQPMPVTPATPIQ